MSNREEEKEKVADSLYRYIGYCRSEQLSQNGSTINREPYPVAIDKWFFTYRKALNKKHRQQTWLKMSGPKVALAASIFVAVFCSTFFSVDAFRVNVLNFLFDKNDIYTGVNVEEGAERINETIPSSWATVYIPKYVPATYALATAQEAGVIITIVYRDDVGNELFFSQGDRNSSFQVDTEEASSEEIQIDNAKGLLVNKNHRNTLLWYTNDSTFCVVGVLPVEELLRFAESIEISK